MTPTIGRIVHYILSEYDAEQINKRRADAFKNKPTIVKDATGYVAHVGNEAKAGQVLPLIITRVWSDTLVNGQLVLDGNDSLWKTSTSEATDDGQAEGHWSWPPRV